MVHERSFLTSVALSFLFTSLIVFSLRSEVLAGQLTLSWADNSDSEDGFKIERRSGSSTTFAQIAIVGANVTSYIDASLSNGASYCYRVQAFNSAGNSGYSNEQCGTTAAATTTFTLTVNKSGTGSGTVTGTGINCGADCTEVLASGTSITLTATAASGSTFAGWSGTGCSTGTVTLSGNITCTATFNPSTFTVTVNKSGTGSGTVTGTGINCGADCTEVLASGTSITLTATAASGSTFAGWSGTGCSTGTVTLNGNMTCTATFNLNQTTSSFTLTVNKSGTGSGTVTTSPTGINCGATCAGTYSSGTSVTLTPVAANGSTFTGWSGNSDCTDGSVTMNANKSCTANFAASQAVLSVSKVGSGTVTSTSSGINCGTICSASYPLGSSVGLQAAPAPGYVFAGWSGLCQGAAGCIILLTASQTITATFVPAGTTNPIDKIGVYRPSTGQWLLDINGNGVLDNCSIDLCVQSFANANGIPVVGEWTAAGVTQLGFFVPDTSQWQLDANANENWDGCGIDICLERFGEDSDIPISGRWSAKGNDRIGVFRPSTGRWYLDVNGNGKTINCTLERCGYLKVYEPGDLPVTGDWTGDGITKLGLFRPRTGEWFLNYYGYRIWNGCGKDRCIDAFGTAADLPVSGDWNGTGTSKIGVFRPSTGEWFLDFNGNGRWDGCGVDVCVTHFGQAGDFPVVGKW